MHRSNTQRSKDNEKQRNDWVDKNNSKLQGTMHACTKKKKTKDKTARVHM